MNIEYKQGIIATSKILFATAISALYWLAGRGPILGINFHRRFYLPLLMIIACISYDFIQKGSIKRWLRLLCYVSILPFYYLFMTIFSYGAGSWLRPLGIPIQRFIVGLTWSIPALPVAWINKEWWLYGLHIILFTSIMTILGTINPLVPSAEEAILGLLFALLVPFMVNDRD